MDALLHFLPEVWFVILGLFLFSICDPGWVRSGSGDPLFD